MVHFAEIDNKTNIVKNVIVCDSKKWCESNLGSNDTYWVRTYYNTKGKVYASKGYTYHPDQENFSAPQPYPSWVLNGNFIWQPPVERPRSDTLSYHWDEDSQTWIAWNGTDGDDPTS